MPRVPPRRATSFAKPLTPEIAWIDARKCSTNATKIAGDACRKDRQLRDRFGQCFQWDTFDELAGDVVAGNCGRSWASGIGEER